MSLRLAGDGPRRRGRSSAPGRPPHKMKVQRGALPERQRRATTTSASSATSPSTRSTRRSRTASRTRSARSRSGKLADLVLWKPAFFGVKPELVLKGGLIAWRADGRPERLDPDAAAGALPADVRRARRRARARRRVTFVSQAALDDGRRRALGLRKRARRRSRDAARIGKRDMMHNDALPRSRSTRETYEVRADGELLTCEPADGAAAGAALLPVLSRCDDRAKSLTDRRPAAWPSRRRDGRHASTADAGFDDRQRSRLRLRRRRPRGGAARCRAARVLRDGDVLRGRGRHASCAVRAAPETLSRVHAERPAALARAAYHLGNRHCRSSLATAGCAYEHDHVLDDMVRGLGARGRRRDGAVRARGRRLRTATAWSEASPRARARARARPLSTDIDHVASPRRADDATAASLRATPDCRLLQLVSPALPIGALRLLAGAGAGGRRRAGSATRPSAARVAARPARSTALRALDLPVLARLTTRWRAGDRRRASRPSPLGRRPPGTPRPRRERARRAGVRSTRVAEGWPDPWLEAAAADLARRTSREPAMSRVAVGVAARDRASPLRDAPSPPTSGARRRAWSGARCGWFRSARAPASARWRRSAPRSRRPSSRARDRWPTTARATPPGRVRSRRAHETQYTRLFRS